MAEVKFETVKILLLKSAWRRPFRTCND